jgi:hypothetical protein
MLKSPRFNAFERDKKISIISERIWSKVVQEEPPELLVLYQFRNPSFGTERQDDPIRSKT